MKRKWMLLLTFFAMNAVTSSVIASDSRSTGAFSYSTDAAMAAKQKTVKQVIETYQKGLNTADTDALLTLFSKDAVFEWNNKATFVGVEAAKKPYKKLFAKVRFNTDFQYDQVSVYNDIAIVRTHHPVGQTENFIDGRKELDFNREIFVLEQSHGAWKIILYAINTQPQQGVQ